MNTEVPYKIYHNEIISFGHTLYQISNNLESEEGCYNLLKYDLSAQKILDKYLKFDKNIDRSVWALNRYASKYQDKALSIP